MSGRHWLANTLARASVPGAEGLAIPAGSPVAEAWRTAAEALGLSPDAIAAHVASRFHLRLADVGAASGTAAKVVPETAARKHHVLPLREDDREIVVATADPTDFEAEQVLAFASGRKVVFEIAPPDAIEAALARTWPPHAAVDALMERVDGAPAESVQIVPAGMKGAIAGADTGEATSVVRLTNLLLRTAVDHEADALRVGPAGDSAAVWLRVDGVWSRLMPLPLPAMRHLVKRFGILDNMGIATGAKTDRVARIRVEGRNLDLRITRTGQAGDGVEILLFDPEYMPLPHDLGIEGDTAAALGALLARERLVMLAGPHPAAVALLQYALLRELAAQGRSVVLADEHRYWNLRGAESWPVDADTRAETVSQLGTRPFEVIGIDAARDADTVRALAGAVAPGRLVLLRSDAESAAAARTELLARAPGPLPAEPHAILLRALRRMCPACGGQGCTACRNTGFRGVLPLVVLLEPGADQADEAERLARAANRWVERGLTTAAEVERALGTAAVAEPSQRPLVLVVDDDPLIRELARTVLDADGLDSIAAEDGREALDHLRARSDIDLIVLDLDMPRLDGRAVLAELKRDLRTAGLPVVVLTASNNPHDESRVLEQGAADYIRKPIEPPRFQARIRAVLRRNHG